MPSVARGWSLVRHINADSVLTVHIYCHMLGTQSITREPKFKSVSKHVVLHCTQICIFRWSPLFWQGLPTLTWFSQLRFGSHGACNLRPGKQTRWGDQKGCLDGLTCPSPVGLVSRLYMLHVSCSQNPPHVNSPLFVLPIRRGARPRVKCTVAILAQGLEAARARAAARVGRASRGGALSPTRAPEEPEGWMIRL